MRPQTGFDFDQLVREYQAGRLWVGADAGGFDAQPEGEEEGDAVLHGA